MLIKKCLRIRCNSEINNPGGRRCSARASVSGNKRIEKSYKEGFSPCNPCKTDALFAP